MKKIVSLLAVALFATTFAAGCGKYTKCNEATKKEDCEKADNFDKEKDDKGNCFWNEKANDGKGKCEVKGSGAPAAYTPTDADKKVCTDLTGADDAACKAEHDKLAADKQVSAAGKAAGYSCKQGTAGKCELKK